MSRILIDRDDLLMKINNEGGVDAQEEYFQGWDDAIERAEELVSIAPIRETVPELTPEAEKIIMQRAIEYWGVQKQSDQCVQEMSELIHAIMKIRQLEDAPHNEQVEAMKNLVEEIADVEIMIDQMKLMYNATDIRVQREIKLERLSGRLRKSEDARRTDDSGPNKWEVW